MKLRFIQQISVPLLMVLLIATGCSTTTVNHYPSSRRSSSVHALPPGQAKKVYGHQSAKAFAPGQQKKKGKGHHGHGKSKGHKKK